MVHNGIEYGDMQLIAEASFLMKNLFKLSNDQIASTFTEWNKGILESYLIEITAKVFATPHPDDESKSLIDDVLDVAGSKGTGLWTSQESLARGVPCPTIQAALESRYISGFLDLRGIATKTFGALKNSNVEGFEVKNLKIEDLEQALYCSKVCSYAQGMMLLKKASDDFGYKIDLAKVASIWTGGCIIRASFLEHIQEAFTAAPHLANLVLHPFFAEKITKMQNSWRKIVSSAALAGCPIPALSTSLNYFDTLSTARLPLNVVQAQRDFFGAHTFKRLSQQGTFHADWEIGKWAEQQ